MRLTYEVVSISTFDRDIRAMAADGLSTRSIATRLKISPTSVHRISEPPRRTFVFPAVSLAADSAPFVGLSFRLRSVNEAASLPERVGMIGLLPV